MSARVNRAAAWHTNADELSRADYNLEFKAPQTGPAGCEITGATGTPDGRTVFVDIQHPGESPSERSDPATPTRYSNWSDKGNNRPRSATVVIRRVDGGVIGA